MTVLSLRDWKSLVLAAFSVALTVVEIPAAIVHVVLDPPVETTTSLPFAALDLNSDGQDDLEIENRAARLYLLPVGQNRVSVDLLPPVVASVTIGTMIQEDLTSVSLDWIGRTQTSPTTAQGPLFQSCLSNGAGRFCGGNFQTEPGYFGIEFDIAGELHYGWVRAEGDPIFVRSTIFEWAYEDVPGRGIAAGAVPEPGVPLLALAGTAMLALRRRRRA